MQQVVFTISTGQIVADGVLIGLAYSGGDAGVRLEAVNNPTFQDQHNIGPIPAGQYSAKLVDQPNKGPRVWVLQPDSSNQMYGRSGFMVHWDTPVQNFKASDGCIVPTTRGTFTALEDQFALTVQAS